MDKTLIVAKPYAWMEPGEKFTLSDNGTMYTNTRTDEYSNTDKDTDIFSRVETNYSISTEIAKKLMDEGVLTTNDTKKSDFVNVFDTMDNMLVTYQEDLDNIDKDMKNAPACLKIEKETVLRNLIKTVSYLRSLKK